MDWNDYGKKEMYLENARTSGQPGVGDVTKQYFYQLCLDNKVIDANEISQYIPTTGRYEVEDQNFSNRMLAYLMRITNASKMAEKKLKMKADKGKLIYPKQIKRGLGAKIIYDAICPVASNAFYGFNPYEKENYGSMG